MSKVLMQAGRFTIEAEGDQKTVFEQLHSLAELFSGVASQCGVCGNQDVSPQVREVDDNKYYEMVCNDKACRAKLSYGQHKKGGTLFPKRKDKDGKYIPKNGWEKYVPEKKTEGA